VAVSVVGKGIEMAQIGAQRHFLKEMLLRAVSDQKRCFWLKQCKLVNSGHSGLKGQN